uniref:Uncharacterized protein n=1 Tax=Glossina palpalis gambiensis TaxID=67801 RepID=A0A1B0AQ14_9MUSC
MKEKENESEKLKGPHNSPIRQRLLKRLITGILSSSFIGSNITQTTIFLEKILHLNPFLRICWCGYRNRNLWLTVLFKFTLLLAFGFVVSGFAKLAVSGGFLDALTPWEGSPETDVDLKQKAFRLCFQAQAQLKVLLLESCVRVTPFVLFGRETPGSQAHDDDGYSANIHDLSLYKICGAQPNAAKLIDSHCWSSPTIRANILKLSHSTSAVAVGLVRKRKKATTIAVVVLLVDITKHRLLTTTKPDLDQISARVYRLVCVIPAR